MSRSGAIVLKWFLICFICRFLLSSVTVTGSYSFSNFSLVQLFLLLTDPPFSLVEPPCLSLVRVSYLLADWLLRLDTCESLFLPVDRWIEFVVCSLKKKIFNGNKFEQLHLFWRKAWIPIPKTLQLHSLHL